MKNLSRFWFWRWLTTPDPTPGFTMAKIGKLLLKSLLFAFVAVTIQSLLVTLGLSFFKSTWGTLVIVLLVYIPFARILSVDFAPPPRAVRGGPVGRGQKARVKKRKYAGVKKGGPKL